MKAKMKTIKMNAILNSRKDGKYMENMINKRKRLNIQAILELKERNIISKKMANTR